MGDRHNEPSRKERADHWDYLKQGTKVWAQPWISARLKRWALRAKIEVGARQKEERSEEWMLAFAESLVALREDNLDDLEYPEVI